MLDFIQIGSHLFTGVAGLRQPTHHSDMDWIMSHQHADEFIAGKLSQGWEVHDGGHPVRKSFYLKKEYEGIVHEVEVAREGSCAEKLLILLRQNYVKSIDLAYTLKLSHRFLRNSPHFEKTHFDIRALRSIGASVPECLKDWLVEREKETYYYNHPKLNQSKDKFFDTPNVIYIYDHDSIHLSVSIEGKPAYTNFLVGEVKTSKKLFNDLPFSVKLNAVLEEASVLAIERSLVNKQNPSQQDIDGVWIYSLQKVCTSITSGWFREFAWENYTLCKKLYYSRVNGYYQRFLGGVESGIVVKL